MNRRDLFKYAGAAGALSMLSPVRRLVAAPGLPTPKRLIMVLAQGGWDVTYALDPKVQSTKIDVPVGAARQFGNLSVFTDASRPNVTNFFTKYASVSAVVRGISVASVAHQECLKRMATGTRNETNPDMGAIIAHDNGNDLPLPYLILGDTAYAGQYAVSAGRVGATNQIIALLDPAQAYPTNGRTPLVTTNAEDAILTKYANATANRLRATRGATGYNRKRVDDFEASIKRGKQLQGVRDGFGARGRTLTLTSQVDLALDALARDVSQSVMINTRLGWDTHDNNIEQSAFHETTFGGLTGLVDGLASRPGRAAGTTMLDDTVVVCFSEFSRTPKINAQAGKDHWPVTSALVIGAGVKGGRGFGASTDGLEAATVDFATGARSATGLTLMSNHFVAGVLKLCGVDAAGHLGATEVFDALSRELLIALVLTACGTDSVPRDQQQEEEIEEIVIDPDQCETSYLDYNNFGAPFVINWCRGCHSSAVPAGMRQKAPMAVNFDDHADVMTWGEAIKVRAASTTPTMPPAGGPSAEERALLAEWLACGVK